MEIIMYSTRSVYAVQRRARFSPDPEVRSVAVQELLDLLGLTHTGPTPTQIDAMVAEVAANGTINGVNLDSITNGTADVGSQPLTAGGTMGANQSAVPAANQTGVPTLSVPGGLTNVTGGVDNTL